MHLEIDRHWEKDSLLHRLDPRLRIIAVVLWAVGLLWIWSTEAAAAGFALAVALALCARIPCKDIVFRLLGVTIILSPLLIVFPLAATSATRGTEFVRALGILLKGCAIMLLSFPLFSTSRFHVTLGGFRSLGVPRALISVFLLAYRALFIFLEDRRRMELSAKTRGWAGGGGRRAFALTASHVGSLLVRSLDRTDRLWHAMQTRGFVGAFPLLDRSRIAGRDVVLFSALVLVPALLVALEYLIDEKALKIGNLSFAWEGDRRVLDRLCLTVDAEETVGLVGANGAGKTTLFLLAAGIVKPSEGDIEVLGARPGAPELRGNVGLVFQSTDEQLFCSSVEEDVAFGPVNLGLPPEDVETRVREALGLVGLSGWEGRVPHHLSGGEKRKVALASVLSMQPKLLLLDEPTSDLGPKSRREVLEVLRGLPGAKVVATHDFEFLLEIADRVAVLANGRIALEGPPAAVFREEAVLGTAELEISRGLRALLAAGS